MGLWVELRKEPREIAELPERIDAVRVDGAGLLAKGLMLFDHALDNDGNVGLPSPEQRPI